jgi:hypothetical protein
MGKYYRITPKAEVDVQRLQERIEVLEGVLHLPSMAPYAMGIGRLLEDLDGKLKTAQVALEQSRQEDQWWINEAEGSLRNALINCRPEPQAKPNQAVQDAVNGLRKARQAKPRCWMKSNQF